MAARTRALSTVFVLVVALTACGPSASLNRDWGVNRVEATRQDLEEVQSHFESGMRSQAYSPELRAWTASEAAGVRARLQSGDFQVGDRVVLLVQGDSALTDTFTVGLDLTLELPELGQVGLTGVLRSELEVYLTEQIGRFINDPVVRATSFMRVSVTGDVTSPGFYYFSPETPLSEAIMLAGGPIASGNLNAVRVDRGNEWILAGQALLAALGQGTTLAELGLQSGDDIVVPRQTAFSQQFIYQTLLVISGIILAINQVR